MDNGTNEEGVEIFTGYYARTRAYLKAGCALIGISVGVPKWLGDGVPIVFRRQLAPLPFMLSIEDEAEYTRLFMSRVLGRLDRREEVSAIRRTALAAKRRRVALLCFEKPPSFCHRSLVARWLNGLLGMGAVREFPLDDPAFAVPPQPSPATPIPSPSASLTNGTGRTGARSVPAMSAPMQGDLFAAAGVAVPNTALRRGEQKDWS